MIKRILFIIFTLATLTSIAQDTKFTMSAPSIVSIGEQFSLTLTLNAKGKDAKLPELGNFEILMGPSVSSSTSIQIINGKTSRTVNYSYTYILRAKKEGTYTISPATIRADGDILQSNTVTIKAIQGKQQSPSTGQSNQQTQQGTDAQTGSRDNLFIQFETNKRSVYKGESLLTTFKLYSRVGLSLVDQTLPSFEGFWTQDIKIPNADQTRTREAVDGVIYNVYTLQKKILIPQQTGTLTIDPAEMVIDVQKRVRSQSVFDDFFGSYQNVRTKIKSEPVSIRIKALPAAPANFGGAVGNFQLNSSIDKTEIKANEAITIKTTISGNGNLKHINPIKFDLPPDFEVYDPQTSYNHKVTDNGISGSTTFEQVIIPRFAGDFTIPKVNFVYFDTQTDKYRTLSTQQFDIHVEEGSEGQSSTVMSSMSKEDVKYIGQDIRYIKQNNIELKEKGTFLFGTVPFYGSYAIAFIFFITIAILQKKKARENANIALTRNKKASKIARKHLKAASSCVKHNNKEEFYDALQRAFWGYLSDKLSIPQAELNRDNARATLLQNNVNEETINEFISLIDNCEMARFAPSMADQPIDKEYKQAEKLIGKFEKQIRKKA
ncbi:MAG TPA: BatD family protein [Prolixibacteraceae bacterium]|nr:BatD family protein [Prolixibacteraceae bacterium]